MTNPEARARELLADASEKFAFGPDLPEQLRDQSVPEKHLGPIARMALAALRSQREATIEECAKAICPLCASGVRIDTDSAHAGSTGQFVGYHVVTEEARDGLPEWEECAATAIRALTKE